MDDNELVILLKNKDKNAYKYLYDEYYKYLYKIVYSMLDNNEDTKDIVHDTLEVACEKIDQLKGNFKYWLITIAKNSAKQKVNEYVKIRERNENMKNNIEQNIDENKIMELKDLMNRLPELEKQVFMYYTINQFTFEEIGLIIGKSKSSVERIYKKARNTMRVSSGLKIN